MTYYDSPNQEVVRGSTQPDTEPDTEPAPEPQPEPSEPQKPEGKTKRS